MFLPIGDAPNPKGTPYITYLLIAANVAVFLLVNLPLGARRPALDDPRLGEYVEVLSQELESPAQLQQVLAQTSEYELFAFQHGYRPNAPQAVDLLSCMFLHGGFMHLFGNMLFLWIYGDNVERRFGALPYLFAYLVTGIVATLAHALVFSSSDVPLVGASGAISGVLGFYFVLFPRNTVRMLAFLPPFLMHVFLVPARFVLGMYLLFDNLVPFLFAGEGGIAHGAHLGGFIAGALAAWLVDRRSVDGRRPEVEVVAHPSSVEGVREALDAGQYAEAARRYFALPSAATRGALSPSEAVELAGFLREQGHSEAALAVLRRATRDFSRGARLGEAHALAGAILLEDLRQPTTAYQYLLSALEIGASAEVEAAVRRMLEGIDALQKRQLGRLHSPPGWQGP